VDEIVSIPKLCCLRSKAFFHIITDSTEIRPIVDSIVWHRFVLTRIFVKHFKLRQMLPPEQETKGSLLIGKLALKINGIHAIKFLG
jgi:hypothetical protein